jgi:hypothetical protein
VVFHRNVREDGKLIAEFSWTSMQPLAKRRLKAEPWNTAWSVAGRWLHDGGKAQEDLKKARYYMNAEHASPAGLCWFKRNTVSLGTSIGNHTFYRRPATVSEWMEVRSVSPDCYASTGS